MTAREIASLEASGQRMAFAEVARRCCVVELEERLFRGFGVATGVLPDMSIEYLDISENQRVELIASFPSTTDFYKRLMRFAQMASG